MKIVSIVGARPQFIKLGPISTEIRKYSKEIIIHTGQHYDQNMSESFFNDLNIPKPDYNLEVSGGMHGFQSGNMMIALEDVISEIKPNLIIVFGDTNSTLAGALVASKLNVDIIHIEAGLRSFNREMPEEINRIVADHISTYLFAPTNTAVNNLENEGLNKRVYLTGDIMVDALKNNINRANEISTIKEKLNLCNNYFLLTMHRPYNVDNLSKVKLLLEKINQLSLPVVFPVHPRTKNILGEKLPGQFSNICFTPPASYIDFLYLQSHANKIITDSGGIQKEAYLLKKPCITIRSETEWVETVEDGWNQLLNPNEDNFIESIESFNPDSEQRNVFGVNVAKKMSDIIQECI